MDHSPVRAFLATACAVALLPFPARSYDAQLSDTAVREAYFLGQRRDEKMAAFFSPYVQHFSLPEKGPYISEIELLTPYAQIVDVSRMNSAGYSAQQALIEYRERGDTVLLRIRIELTVTYPVTQSVPSPVARDNNQAIRPRPNDFWRDFRFGLSQNDHWIEPQSMRGEPIYGGEGGSGSSRQLLGAYVYLLFDAQDVASGLAQAEVFAPDSVRNPQHVITTFDLAHLR